MMDLEKIHLYLYFQDNSRIRPMPWLSDEEHETSSEVSKLQIHENIHTVEQRVLRMYNFNPVYSSVIWVRYLLLQFLKREPPVTVIEILSLTLYQLYAYKLYQY